ncbi:flagellar hook-length control protein [Streptomyces zagrosensis]|uniref:Flagellar hook-length control protein n=1 Tax=Streptomyces zagrosensis TaxID=1042984 RepID=A0A7W9Q9M1_9ACTN|nr:flagellar hook-length control protein [Streptomyces zagrosensis]MBB5935032.1 hypothetical protein [Streptomyces zagrosensis]
MRSITLGAVLGAAVLTVATGIASPAVAQPVQPGQPGQPGHIAANDKAMTWTLIGAGPSGTVQVGGGPLSDAYQGDTSTTKALPVLCLKADGSVVPDGVTPDFYAGWARGRVAASDPVRGTRLTSLAVANRVCANKFGKDWRMAEFHDGRYGPNLQYSGGWSYWAYGDVPADTRFWTAIYDQQSNPWN